MEKIEVFKYKTFNIDAGGYEMCVPMATREIIERQRGIVIEGTGRIIDSSSLSDRQLFMPPTP